MTQSGHAGVFQYRCCMIDTITLGRADKNRGGNRWSDYNVYDGERVIGRIILHPQAPEARQWLWTITARGRKASMADRGYAASREDALADFKSMWFREVLTCPRVVDLPTPSVASFIARCAHCNGQIWVVLDSARTVRRMWCNAPKADVRFGGQRIEHDFPSATYLPSNSRWEDYGKACEGLNPGAC